MLSRITRSATARRARPRRAVVPAVLVVTLLGGRLAAQEPTPAPPGDTAEGLVRHLYDLVTFPAGQLPDWDAVRSAFIPQAVIVLRTGRTETTVMSVDDFLADWHRFVEEADVEATGFREEITALVPLVFGDIAHVLVLYEASIPGRMPEPQEGVDSFHLIRRDGRWWIAGILNEIPTPERPVPAMLREAPGGGSVPSQPSPGRSRPSG